MQSRLWHYRHLAVQYTLGNMLSLSLSIMIGSTTHVVWDAFTHSTGWGVLLLPQLSAMFSVFGPPVPGYKILQYGSTLLGLPALMFAGARFLARMRPRTVIHRNTFSIFAAWTILASFLGIPCLFMAYYIHHKPSLYMAFGAMVMKSFTVSIGMFFLYSLIYWWFHHDVSQQKT
jgi:hypothetical protein